jgi:hypothetical protein
MEALRKQASDKPARSNRLNKTLGQTTAPAQIN